MASGSILYVDDDDAAALLIRVALEESDAGLQCFRVSDVENALKFLDRAGEYWEAPQPDLILLDLNLPRRSGLELLTALKQSEVLHHIPVVVFTSSAAPADRVKSLGLGANAYVRKPATFAEYISSLREMIKIIPQDHPSLS